jgi:hypothetical protein
MGGAMLFAIGSGVALFETAIDSRGAVFFVGSIVFTVATYLQLLEIINEPDPLSHERPRLSLWRWEPHKIGWWAVTVQLFGTILFNVSTWEAMQALRPTQQDELVWAPDAVGSICFVVASYLAFAEVCRSWACWQLRNISWWIVVINLAGSISFGVSAVASFVIFRTGEMMSGGDASAWTFVGAICFFVGAYLLLPEMTAHADSRSNEV